MKKLSLNEMQGIQGGGCERAIFAGGVGGAVGGAIAGSIAGPGGALIGASGGFFGGMITAWIDCALR
jgi:hypothetical protein